MIRAFTILRGDFSAPFSSIGRLVVAVLSAATLLCISIASQAQLVIDVTTSAGRQIPIALAPFANEDSAPQNITPIISNNLARTGLFRIVNTAGLGVLPSEPSEVNFTDWTARSTEALVIGGIYPLADGRFGVRFRMFHVAKQSHMTSISYPVAPSQPRPTAHRIPDPTYHNP